jgi:hypothetical protein
MRDDVNADAEPTDYTHAFLREMKRREEANDVSPYFNDNQLALMLFDLWVFFIRTLKYGYRSPAKKQLRMELYGLLPI